MVNLEKWTKGNYYSCTHQQKGSNKCITCDQNIQIKQRGGHVGLHGVKHQYFECELCKMSLGKQSKNFYINVSDDEVTERETTIDSNECYKDNDSGQHRLDKNEKDWVCSNCKDQYLNTRERERERETKIHHHNFNIENLSPKKFMNFIKLLLFDELLE